MIQTTERSFSDFHIPTHDDKVFTRTKRDLIKNIRYSVFELERCVGTIVNI